ncbi:MAG: DUF1002 domain-containing protein [Firmicutes bacterium]|jgi:uncharacterized protein YpuA (DUF1002 family)|nr:DUF1002 domain-containing protein [Bacillota bacterium]HQD39118.1 DUF1002 domain-containing protein [Bacillota bacterium]
MMKLRLKVCFLLALVFFCLNLASAQRVLVWGEDLTQRQKEDLRQILLSKGADLEGAEEISVTNAEEREALAGKVDLKAVGTRAISSVYIKVGVGRGVKVETHNITLITPQMYRSALVTGGVKQAEVIALAPTPVSGTAALTGIFKAYELITGQELSQEAKDAATEELVQAGELGKDLGQEKASELMQRIKAQVLKERPQTLAEVEEIVREAAEKMKVSLNQGQLEKLSRLFYRIGKLPLSLRDMEQLLSTGFWQKLGSFFAQAGKVLLGLWQRLVALFA